MEWECSMGALKWRCVVFETKKMTSLCLGVFVRDMVLMVLHEAVSRDCGKVSRCPEWGARLREIKVESRRMQPETLAFFSEH